MFEEILRQIDVALDNDLYYVALFTALTLPDICGALDSEDGEASRDNYIGWFDKYVMPRTGNLFNGVECWYFRCTMLHQGRAQHSRRRRYKKIVFLDPDITRPNYRAIHNVVKDGILYIDVFLISHAMVMCAREWLEKVKGTDRFKENYNKFIGYRPIGVPYLDEESQAIS